MAKTPTQWIAQVRCLCTRAGLLLQDAEECVAETLTRYSRRRGTYPWDDPAPDEPLLRLLAHNVACEYKRTTARRQQLERDYCAQQQAVIAAAATPEEQAIANADAAQFRASLPRYLRHTLTLLEAGYTPAETAQQLGVSVSTVYTYIRDLKAHFVEFFGYDPRIRGRCVVNYSGSAQTGFQSGSEEVYDEAASKAFGSYGVGVSDSEPCGDARHLGCAERVQRGGTCIPQ
ncbi:MAG: hypothetical protein NZ843_02565 [Fimbriimonadales bacterium]|nr:hypothetical protein [Fimbriimonadales bacterium]